MRAGTSEGGRDGGVGGDRRGKGGDQTYKTRWLRMTALAAKPVTLKGAMG